MGLRYSIYIDWKKTPETAINRRLLDRHLSQ